MSTVGDDSTRAQETQLLFITIEQSRTVNYTRVASVALLAYDISVMLGLEIELIWRARWSLPKMLYIIARYYAFICLVLDFFVSTQIDLSLRFCRGYSAFYLIAGVAVAGTIVNAILTLRLYALYGKKKTVLVWLLVIFASNFAVSVIFRFEISIALKSNKAELAISVVITAYQQRHIQVVPGLPLPGCLAPAPPVIASISWVPRLVSSTLFFLMTLYKMFKPTTAYNRRVALRSINLKKKHPPLLVSFYLDGAIYYFVIASLVLICTVTTATLDGPLVLVAAPFLHAGYSLAVCRLILNLRRTVLGRNASATWAETVSFRANEDDGTNDTDIALETFRVTR